MGGLVVKPILKMPSTTNFVGLSRFGPTFRATSCLFNVYGNCVKVVCGQPSGIYLHKRCQVNRLVMVLYRFVVVVVYGCIIETADNESIRVMLMLLWVEAV